MSIKVFKYGALPLPSDSRIRDQMRLGRKYYNCLVETENKRRQSIWGANSPPRPPHDDCKCDECKSHWKRVRDIYHATSPLDVKQLRSQAVENGLYWGTYLMIEEAFSAAWKKTDCFSPVRFKSWRDGGVMGVQIQTVTNPASFINIAHAADPRTGRRAGQRHTLRVRVGSNEDRSPKWSEPIAFEMHRPLQGRITWVKICLHYSGSREVWSVNLTCADIPERNDSATTGCVAIDVGWRKMSDDTLRIAFATGDDGKEYNLALSDRWTERTRRADRIRGYRDDRLNELKSVDSRLVILHKPSGVERFAANHYVDESIGEWIKREHHLAEYENGCRRKSVMARRDIVRVWLRMLRRKSSLAVIKNSSHREMKNHKKAVESGIYPPARRNAHHGAPGEIIEEITRVFGRDTGTAIVESADTTATCPACGTLMEVGAGLIVRCERCGAEHDRDRVSTRNMMDLYRRGETKKPTARKTTARFVKRHKKLEQAQQC